MNTERAQKERTDDIEANVRDPRETDAGPGQRRPEESARPRHRRDPDEAKRFVQEKVERAIGMVAGALEGFVNKMEEHDIPEKSRRAVETAAETTRKLAKAGRGLKGQEEKTEEALDPPSHDPKYGLEYDRQGPGF